ncbi:hypothetical protein M422DRAFT_89066, partial [Sphaerobolus stellatus SS14]
DTQSRFWVGYERLARQTDESFLERYNGDLDVQLIFAGLFSAVSSTFIVDMNSNIQPDETATTNTLLTVLVNATLNRPITNSDTAALSSNPVPNTLIVWTLIMGYLSLFLSLLAAFGAVLGKQW